MKRLLLIATTLLLPAMPVFSASINDTDTEALLAIAQRLSPLRDIADLEALQAVFADSRIASRADFDKARLVANATPHGEKWLFAIPNLMEWLEAEAPKSDPEIQYFLGKTYLYGEEVFGERYFYFDAEKGRRWLDAAIAQGYAPAMLALAAYAMLDSEYDEAEALLLRAAEGGDDSAQYNLGVFYNTKSRISHERHPFAGARPALKDDPPYFDPEKAAAWWKKAADQGNADAMAELAILHAIHKEPAAAFTFAEKAAQLGHPFSQNLLGGFYQAGVGVDRDPVLAYKWLSIAFADMRCPRVDAVQEHREAVAAEMTEAEIAEATKQAEEWMNDFLRRRESAAGE